MSNFSLRAVARARKVLKIKSGKKALKVGKSYFFIYFFGKLRKGNEINQNYFKSQTEV